MSSDDGPPAQGAAGQGDAESAMSATEQALARARANARARGYRPGSLARRTGAPAGRQQHRATPGASEAAGDPQPVGDEVTRLVAARGWDAEVQVGSVIGRWPAMVGEQVAAHVEPVAFEGTSLTVRADSTAWATQMQLLSSSVLARIEAEVGAEVVTELVVHGPGGPSWRRGPLRAPGPGPRDTYG
ncbi:MAG TPA: DciA family protein [Ornithinimicrobium sp.]|uniref:DUF721 domain-containing protein n=1 Tax=Ornithinimicrobium sp. TaxID=1977084 RepID=UPI002B46BE43|nr:DciA family protein [Ornithinimicrobium sp.]HKJ12427.1 DciA family protein [Ornithinimicrobium sp.]